MTGRANSILDEHCTTPLPIPLDEDQFGSEGGKALLKKEKQQGERNPASTPASMVNTPPSTERSRSQSKSQSKPEVSLSPPVPHFASDISWAKNVSPNTSLYFLHLVQLTRVSQRIFQQLYNPAAVIGVWSDIQRMISDLDSSVEAWYRTLPAVFDFKRNQRDRDFYEARLSLGFVYYGIKITISRPCLCRLDRKMPSQSSKSDAFNRTQANVCIDNAKEMLDLIPDVPNAVGLNSVGPWWSLLHWLVQASSVLMLEMSFRSHHMPEEADNIFEAAKKAVRWMHQLGTESFSARRAWLLCDSMLRESAARIGRQVTDMPNEAPENRRPDYMNMTNGDVSMSSSSNPTTYNDAFLNDHTTGLPSYFYSSASIAASTAAQMPHGQNFAPYDPFMRYDQYYPGQSGTTGPDTNTNLTADMDFLNSNAFHDGSAHQRSGSGSHSSEPRRQNVQQLEQQQAARDQYN